MTNYALFYVQNALKPISRPIYTQTCGPPLGLLAGFRGWSPRKQKRVKVD